MRPRARQLRAMRRDVHRLLRTLPSQPICYFKAPGNAGDALIQAGTMAAFKRAKLQWEAVEPGDDVSGRTLVIGGSGNLTPYYDHVELALRAFLESDPRRIVMLPQGVRGHTSILASLREEDLVICRDRVAYRHVLSIGPARGMLAHDMAFHLDADEFLNDPLHAASGRAFLEDRLVDHGWSLQRFDARPTMTFTRLDTERVASTPDTDIDISLELIYGDVNQVSPISAWSLLQCVRHSRRIVTDRLHVAIAASLLRVPTQLWPNSYDKNRSVFDYSLRRFPTIEFKRAFW